jgi:hypothetical protein
VNAVVETEKERLERLWTRCGCGRNVFRCGFMLVCIPCAKVVREDVRK